MFHGRSGWLGKQLYPFRDLDTFMMQAVNPYCEACPEQPGLVGLRDLTCVSARCNSSKRKRRFSRGRYQVLLENIVEWIKSGSWRRPDGPFARLRKSKAVVWAHNSHIGDARYTDMGAVREELNIGQLCRERYGDEAALIGFATHTGTVAAASDWEGDMEIKRVRPSHRDSYEWLCHEAGIPRFLLDLGRHEPLRRRLLEPRLERFIGVIYRPDTELMSHYADASLPQQFDALVWFDETSAVTPLGPEHTKAGVPYPFGL